MRYRMDIDLLMVKKIEIRGKRRHEGLEEERRRKMRGNILMFLPCVGLTMPMYSRHT